MIICEMAWAMTVTGTKPWNEDLGLGVAENDLVQPALESRVQRSRMFFESFCEWKGEDIHDPGPLQQVVDMPEEPLGPPAMPGQPGLQPSHSASGVTIMAGGKGETAQFAHFDFFIFPQFHEDQVEARGSSHQACTPKPDPET